MRQAILTPIDAVDLTLADRGQIEAFADALFEAKPWLKAPDLNLLKRGGVDQSYDWGQCCFIGTSRVGEIETLDRIFICHLSKSGRG